jgi:mRNA degradation ribonuclease J1/J2
VIDAQSDGITIAGRIDVELKFLESDGSGLLSYGELRERLRIGELGLARIDGVYSLAHESWLVEPTIELVGIGFPETMRKADWILSKTTKLKQLVPQLLRQKNLSAEQTAEEVRQLIRRELQRFLRKKPVVSVKMHCV